MWSLKINRTVANIYIDLMAMFLFIGMIATGYLIKFPLPPGTNKALSLWGLTRHQWGSIHFWISLSLMAVLLAHIVIHWQWIITVIGKRFHLIKASRPSLFRSGMVFFFITLIIFVGFAWAAHRSVKEIKKPMEGVCFSCKEAIDEKSTSQIQSNKAEGIVTWKVVSPIFKRKCLSCHGPQKQLGNFRVDRREDFFKSENHDSFIIPGKSKESLLIEILSGAQPDFPMPEKHKLLESELSLLKAWIDAGAK